VLKAKMVDPPEKLSRMKLRWFSMKERVHGEWERGKVLAVRSFPVKMKTADK
jgi:hypothetical protein